MFEFELTRPQYLALLALLPVLAWYFIRSLVDLSRGQRIASLVVRSAVCLLLVLCLCGLNLLKPTRDVFVVFAVDESLSVDAESRDEAESFVDEATKDADVGSFAVIRFGGRGESDETPPLGRHRSQNSDAMSKSEHKAAPDNDALDSLDPRRLALGPSTNLQAAIEEATAGIPPHFVPRVVLLSDGNETAGDALRTAMNSDVRIDTVALKTRNEPEIQVSDVIVPAQVAQGEPFYVEVVVNSNHDDEAVVEVFKGEHRIISAKKELQKGENRFRFQEQVEKPTEFAARIARPSADESAESEASSGESVNDDAADDSTPVFNDTLLDNNMASGLVYAAGKPRVLLIESVPQLAQNLEWALEEEGILVDTRPPQGVPEDLSDLQNYEVLVLSNVAATDLTHRKMDVIRTYVSDLGGGFIMLGGDQSFGLGGYYKSVLEEVLPVRSDFEKEKEKPSLGMVLVIDKSGSMGGQKIELAKDAAKAAVELLGERDQIGVLAFDGSNFWVSEVRSAAQKSFIMDRISGIEAGGGTVMYPAMEDAYDALQATAAKLKHVIVLTDGHSAPGDFEGLTRTMSSSRITVSTVGIGECDTALLERIAEIGKGRYYFTNDPLAIPQIFAKETMTASKSAINEEPFLPQVIRSTPALSDIDFDAAPFLLGYVVTRPKPTSEVILATETGDPLLSWWRYGLGMSAAFTSDAKSRWAAEWLTWPGYNRFWAQVIRQCMRKSDAKGFLVDVERHGSTARVTLDASDPSGAFLNHADTELTLIDPKLKDQKLAMSQVAPGRYEASIDIPDTGAWHLQLSQKKDGQLLYQQSRGLIVGYPDELRLKPTNEELLKSIAAAADGRFNPPATDVLENETEEASRATELWPWLLMAALILFVVDVALRRIDVTLLFPTRVSRG
ncbi:MAG: FixH family protein [Planctomycetota bacterium]|jgi:uncharacterized membrane protein